MTRLIDADASKSMHDLISRQAVIDAIDRYYKDKRYITRSRTILSAICQDMKSTMDSLPSAQPEIIRCKDCKYYREDGDCWHEWDNDGRIYYQSVINEPNPDDYCSRAERKEE